MAQWGVITITYAKPTLLLKKVQLSSAQWCMIISSYFTNIRNGDRNSDTGPYGAQWRKRYQRQIPTQGIWALVLACPSSHYVAQLLILRQRNILLQTPRRRAARWNILEDVIPAGATPPKIEAVCRETDEISGSGGRSCPVEDRCHNGGGEGQQIPFKQEHRYAERTVTMQQMAGSGGRRSPYFGHEEQCYSFDNRCHCSSTQPYQLPPEGYGTSQLPPAPPLNVRMTPQQIQIYYSSHVRGMHHSTPYTHPLNNPHITSQQVNNIDNNSPSHSLRGEEGGWASSRHGHMPAVTNPSGMQQRNDPPPPYDSLPNIRPVEEQPPPPYHMQPWIQCNAECANIVVLTMICCDDHKLPNRKKLPYMCWAAIFCFMTGYTLWKITKYSAFI